MILADVVFGGSGTCCEFLHEIYRKANNSVKLMYYCRIVSARDGLWTLRVAIHYGRKQQEMPEMKKFTIAKFLNNLPNF